MDDNFPPKAKAIIDRNDEDGDGRLSKEEYVKIMMKRNKNE